MNNLFENTHAVLFDMDGTLVETNIDFPRMKKEMLAISERYGIPAETVLHLDILSILEYVTSHLEKEGRGIEAIQAKEEAFAMLEDIEIGYCYQAEPISGAVELLQCLREKDIKVGIVTRNSRKGVQISQQRTGIWADALFTRDDVSRIKPHPEHLLEALQALGVPGREAVTVGDHYVDVLAGKAAGTKTVGFLRPHHTDDFFNDTKPDFVIKDLRELLDQLNRLNY